MARNSEVDRPIGTVEEDMPTELEFKEMGYDFEPEKEKDEGIDLRCDEYMPSEDELDRDDQMDEYHGAQEMCELQECVTCNCFFQILSELMMCYDCAEKDDVDFNKVTGT